MTDGFSILRKWEVVPYAFKPTMPLDEWERQQDHRLLLAFVNLAAPLEAHPMGQIILPEPFDHPNVGFFKPEPIRTVPRETLERLTEGFKGIGYEAEIRGRDLYISGYVGGLGVLPSLIARAEE